MDDGRLEPAPRLRLPRHPGKRSRRPGAALLDGGDRAQREHRAGAARPGRTGLRPAGTDDHLLRAARRSRRDPRQRRHAGTHLEQPTKRALRHSAGDRIAGRPALVRPRLGQHRREAEAASRSASSTPTSKPRTRRSCNRLQAAEFLAGPGKGGTIVATGDFNSASDGSTTTSYAQLTAPGKFRDSWNEKLLGPGSSCCQESNTPPLAPGALNNPVSTLRTRIDLILSRGAARSDGDDAQLIGDTPFQATPPFWPSDHAGVVSDLHLGG